MQSAFKSTNTKLFLFALFDTFFISDGGFGGKLFLALDNEFVTNVLVTVGADSSFLI